MEKNMNAALWEMILQEDILNYFEITGLDKGNSDKYIYDKTLTIYLEEKRIIPFESKTRIYKASGFMEPHLIEDYTIRNMTVTLSVKRRRWDVLVDENKLKVTRDLSILAYGTRMSDEYAAFL
ncbi:ISAon1 family transposase N-terminal region protein [Ancylomarina sp. YFZ004]